MTQRPRSQSARGASTAAKCTQEKNGAEDQFVKALLPGEVPLKFPQTPVMHDFGNDMRNVNVRGAASPDPTQPQAAKQIAIATPSATASESADEPAALSFHEGPNRGNQAQVELSQAFAQENRAILSALRGNLSQSISTPA